MSHINNNASSMPGSEGYWHRLLDNLEVTIDAPRRRRHRRGRALPAAPSTPRGLTLPVAPPPRRVRARDEGPLDEHQARRRAMHIYMAHYLGFTSTAALAAWEETMREHLNWYAREVLAEGRTERPDARAMVDYIDLETAAFERLGLSLAEGGPVHVDTAGWKLGDYYKHVLGGIIGKEMWFAMHGQPEKAVLLGRRWPYEQLTAKLINFLVLLVAEWQYSAPTVGRRRRGCRLDFY